MGGGGSSIFPTVVQQLAYLASRAVTPAESIHKSKGVNVGVVYYVCCVCECYRGGIVVMDVIWRRI